MKQRFHPDTLHVGQIIGRDAIEITPALIGSCAAAIEADRPWYRAASPFGGPIAPPTVFADDTLRLLDEAYARFGSIHARQAWQFSQPARVGTRAAITVTVVDKYQRRGGDYIVLELVALDQDGYELCRSRHTSLMSLAKEEA